jgi:transcriptional regulator with XRE-family HTH domain
VAGAGSAATALAAAPRSVIAIKSVVRNMFFPSFLPAVESSAGPWPLASGFARSTLARMNTAVVVPTALTSAQCRAARALIEWSQAQLSQSAGIDVQTVADFEKRFRKADETTRRRLRATLEAAGVVFISENGGGGGVRLKFSREEVWEVNRWEDEGGVPGEDDIL